MTNTESMPAVSRPIHLGLAAPQVGGRPLADWPVSGADLIKLPLELGHMNPMSNSSDFALAGGSAITQARVLRGVSPKIQKPSAVAKRLSRIAPCVADHLAVLDPFAREAQIFGSGFHLHADRP